MSRQRQRTDLWFAGVQTPAAAAAAFLQAMEAHGAAEQLRQAAEVKSQRFFEAMNAASAASRRADWAAHPNNHYDAFADVEAAIQQVRGLCKPGSICVRHQRFCLPLACACCILRFIRLPASEQAYLKRVYCSADHTFSSASLQRYLACRRLLLGNQQ
jgi:hypothetical protein